MTPLALGVYGARLSVKVKTGGRSNCLSNRSAKFCTFAVMAVSIYTKS
jgi:hypothetical protein